MSGNPKTKYRTRRRFIQATGAAGVLGFAGCLGDDDDDDTADDTDDTVDDTDDTADDTADDTDDTADDDPGDEYPSQSIRSIVSWGAGGGTDLTMRQLQAVAEDQSDVEFVTENITGGAGAEGFRTIATAEPNGYTTGVVSPNISTFPHTEAGGDLGPDSVRGVIQYNFDGSAITVHADAPYDTIDEFVDYAQDEGGVQIGNAGPGSTWHLAAAGFADEAGITDEVSHVPYDGASPAIEATMSGEIEANSASAAENYNQTVEQGGDLQVLAVMSEERLDLLPDVPTLMEEGYDWAWGAWRGYVVAPDTPDDVVNTLHDIFYEAWDTDEYQDWLAENGFGSVYRDSDEFDAYMQEQSDAIEPIASDLDI